MMTFSRSIARFVRNLKVENLPQHVVEKARVCMLNGYGIALGSNTTPYAVVARQTAVTLHGLTSDGVTLLGDGRKTNILGAVLANSALFHGRTQDDTCGAAHVGAIVLPVLTALLERRPDSINLTLPALVAGYEVAGLLEAVGAPSSTPAGFRASPLYGALAAAAAAAKLMDLSEDQIAAAIANAASFTGGILQSFNDGTDEWRYQLGFAGVNGLISAHLAAAGSVSAPQALEGPAGFFRTFTRAEYGLEELVSRLGRNWSILNVTFKPYPVCAFNQTPVAAAMVLRERLGELRAQSARVRMNPYESNYAGMSAKGPFKSISGTLMSIPFCIAQTLLRGIPTMNSMTKYDDAEVNDLATRIDLTGDERVPRLCCEIEAVVDDSTTLIEHRYVTTEDYDFPWRDVEALVRKIGAESSVPAEAYDRIVSFTREFPSRPIADVISAFAMVPSSEQMQSNSQHSDGRRTLSKGA